PSTLPHPASQMYARNIAAFVQNLVKKGQLEIKLDDPIIRETLLAREGEVVNARVRERLGLPALAAPVAERSPA
ncbi:MAG: NAD(P)(+) transhydrogenase (Re/Si-specific) subunit alpha, partial [Nevskiales bacterium]